MTRLPRVALVAVALLFAQHAAQLHAFSHLESERRAAAAGGAPAQQDEGQCLAFHLLGCGLPGLQALPCVAPRPAAATFAAPALPRPPRLHSLSRAPPARS